MNVINGAKIIFNVGLSTGQVVRRGTRRDSVNRPLMGMTVSTRRVFDPKPAVKPNRSLQLRYLEHSKHGCVVLPSDEPEPVERCKRSKRTVEALPAPHHQTRNIRLETAHRVREHWSPDLLAPWSARPVYRYTAGANPMSPEDQEARALFAKLWLEPR